MKIKISIILLLAFICAYSSDIIKVQKENGYARIYLAEESDSGTAFITHISARGKMPSDTSRKVFISGFYYKRGSCPIRIDSVIAMATTHTKDGYTIDKLMMNKLDNPNYHKMQISALRNQKFWFEIKTIFLHNGKIIHAPEIENGRYYYNLRTFQTKEEALQYVSSCKYNYGNIRYVCQYSIE